MVLGCFLLVQTRPGQAKLFQLSISWTGFAEMLNQNDNAQPEVSTSLAQSLAIKCTIYKRKCQWTVVLYLKIGVGVAVTPLLLFLRKKHNLITLSKERGWVNKAEQSRSVTGSHCLVWINGIFCPPWARSHLVLRAFVLLRNANPHPLLLPHAPSHSKAGKPPCLSPWDPPNPP